MNMKSEEMFEKLGYEKTECGEIEYYEKYFDLGWARIIFDKSNKTLAITHDSGFANYEYTIENLPISLREAIDARLGELGWRNWERKYCFTD